MSKNTPVGVRCNHSKVRPEHLPIQADGVLGSLDQAIRAAVELVGASRWFSSWRDARVADVNFRDRATRMQVCTGVVRLAEHHFRMASDVARFYNVIPSAIYPFSYGLNSMVDAAVGCMRRIRAPKKEARWTGWLERRQPGDLIDVYIAEVISSSDNATASYLVSAGRLSELLSDRPDASANKAFDHLVSMTESVDRCVRDAVFLADMAYRSIISDEVADAAVKACADFVTLVSMRSAEKAV